MNLQELQTGLLDLIKSRPTIARNSASPYLMDVGRSKELLVVRNVALWWHRLHIETFCTLTSSLLKYKGNFHDEVTAFFNSISYSPYRDEVGIQFLNHLKAHAGDSLIRTIASLELALILLKKGEDVSLSQTWTYEPYAIISGLLNQSLTEKSFNEGSYLVEVSSDNRDELLTVREQ